VGPDRQRFGAKDGELLELMYFCSCSAIIPQRHVRTNSSSNGERGDKSVMGARREEGRRRGE